MSLPQVSGRKRLISETDDAVLTPKKIRSQHFPPTPVSNRKPAPSSTPSSAPLPPSLTHILAAYNAIEDALIPALASTGVAAPTSDPVDPTKFNIASILTHMSIPYVSLDNLKRLVWLLEWDGESLDWKEPIREVAAPTDPDNPFVVPSAVANKNWIRGANGLIISQTTHLNRSISKRTDAYGIGIQVTMEKRAKAMSNMTMVTKWINAGDDRRAHVEQKLRTWVELHRKAARDPVKARSSRASSPTPVQIPSIPCATLPSLLPASVASTPSSLTRRLLRTPVKGTPVKALNLFQTPEPVTPSKNSIPFPTPGDTPSSSSEASGSVPSTPVKATPTRTPSTSRRDALRERIRQRSLSNNATPTKNRVAVTLGTDQDGNVKKKLVSAEELKRRCVLGRIEGIAECVSVMFASGTSSILSSHKKRIMRMDDVVRNVVKSAKSPLSDAEAIDAIDLLMDLCPTFIQCRVIDKERWIEMPSAPPRPPPSPGSSRRFPPSPGGLTQEDVEEELLSRKAGEGSPKKVRPVGLFSPEGKKVMSLRDVREKIRRELEKE
ncbi:hypothetical protein FRC02_004528 [Tulasnella sp. 418]|nr:hypothetical protein FRC02_004528 [Tulasnella sp. 418]